MRPNCTCTVICLTWNITDDRFAYILIVHNIVYIHLLHFHINLSVYVIYVYICTVPTYESILDLCICMISLADTIYTVYVTQFTALNSVGYYMLHFHFLNKAQISWVCIWHPLSLVFHICLHISDGSVLVLFHVLLVLKLLSISIKITFSNITWMQLGKLLWAYLLFKFYLVPKYWIYAMLLFPGQIILTGSLEYRYEHFFPRVAEYPTDMLPHHCTMAVLQHLIPALWFWIITNLSWFLLATIH